MKALRNVKDVTLINIPELCALTLRIAFKVVETVVMDNAGAFEEVDELRARERIVVDDQTRLEELSPGVRVLELSDNCWNDVKRKVFGMEGFNCLRELRIGDECCMHVSSFRLDGLSELESVEIGENSFTQHKNWYGNDPNRHFYLKNCPKLKVLTIGYHSFSDYKSLEIENVDALETLVIGDMNRESFNFHYASLDLTSILIHSE